MEANFDLLFDKVSEHLKSFAKTDTIVGEEFKFGEFSCKPVIKVGIGFGGGSGNTSGHHGKNCDSGTGAGAGVGMAPVGFLVTKNGEISFIPATNKKGLGDLFEKVPDLVEKIIDIKAEKDKKEAKKE
ncbi:MAG: GerW family sporulation protein [Bacteroidales bacterium]|nr:GerW family sporulation protein [Bacteroidales bacterium]